ncbi:hypothetical protein C7R94_11560 [Brevibacillus sp. NRRL NRS-603]|nr:hypothetical protein C7R94_11560 [Brevibacillus sp. NRRL NRS-603]
MVVSPPSFRRLSKVLGVSVAFLSCFEKLPESTLGERIIKARFYYGYTKREFAVLPPKSLQKGNFNFEFSA